jgi:hypothetical protein
MLGILDYEPALFDTVETFINSHYDKLVKIIGLTLDDYWLMWDTRDNEWFSDGPVILKIDNTQFEFTAFQLQFGLTIDKIDLTNKLDWYGAGDELPLIWNNKSNKDIDSLLDRKILDINIITHKLMIDSINGKRVDVESEFMLHGIEFTFEKKDIFDKNNYLQIFNALDENGLETLELEKSDQLQKVNIRNKF